MLRILLHWLLSALAIVVVSKVVPGFIIDSLGAALIAAVVIGFINATLGLVIKIVTFPLTIITLGLFWFIINAVVIELASSLVPGFHVQSFGAALIAAVILSLVNMIIKHLMKEESRKDRIIV